MGAAEPVGLVTWDYWLNQWPATPVALTRANAADGYPKALTPLSQDLVLRFEEAGARRFYFETLKALRHGDCPAPFMQAYYGLVYLNADQMGDLGDASVRHEIARFTTDPDDAVAQAAQGALRVLELRSRTARSPKA